MTQASADKHIILATFQSPLSSTATCLQDKSHSTLGRPNTAQPDLTELAELSDTLTEEAAALESERLDSSAMLLVGVRVCALPAATVRFSWACRDSVRSFVGSL